MGEITDLMHLVDDKLREVNAARAGVLEASAVLRTITDDMAKLGSKIDRLLQGLVAESIEETEGEGGGHRKRKSTNLDPVEGEKKEKRAPRDTGKKVLVGELVEPGSGKRGCGKCHRTGHRATSCPN